MRRSLAYNCESSLHCRAVFADPSRLNAALIRQTGKDAGMVIPSGCVCAERVCVRWLRWRNGWPLLAQMQPLSKLKSHPLIPNAHPLRRPDDPAHFCFHAHPLSLSMLHNALVACIVSRIGHQLKQITHQVWHLSSKNIR